MARPPQADAERTRARILEAACELFAEHGGGKTSMRRIAAAAGVTQATVHHYYGSKDDLHAAAVNAMYAQLAGLRDELAARIVGAPDVAGAVDEAVRAMFRFGVSNRAAVQLTMREVLDAGELATPQTDALLPYLEQGAMLLGARIGRPAEEVRLALLSINFLIVRYCLMSPSDMALTVGGKRARRKHHDEALLALVERHLADAARRLLGV